MLRLRFGWGFDNIENNHMDTVFKITLIINPIEEKFPVATNFLNTLVVWSLTLFELVPTLAKEKP